MKWGLEYESMHPSRFWNRTTFWSVLSTKKSIYVVVKFCAQKSRYADSRKVVSNLVKSLFKWNEGKSRSVCNLVALKEKKNLIWVFYEKKSIHVVVKFCAYKRLGMLGSQKGFFQSCQKPVPMKWGQAYECMHPSRSWNRRIFDLGCVRKNLLFGCQILRSKKSLCRCTKNDFQSSQQFVQKKWGEE